MDLASTPEEELAAAASREADHGQDIAILYVLASVITDDKGGRPAYLLHDVGGVGCVLGYTSLERLVECCGEHQPWLGIRLDALMTDLRDRQLAGPAINLPVRPSAWWTADGASDLAGLLSGEQVSGE